MEKFRLNINAKQKKGAIVPEAKGIINWVMESGNSNTTLVS